MSEDLSGLPAEQEPETGSLEDHEAAFGPGGTGEAPDPEPRTEQASPEPETTETRDQRERDETGKFVKPPRHRAKSQQASPEDVPRIRELTAKLRQAEAERDALRTSPPARHAAPPPEPRANQPAPAQAPTIPHTRPKPTEDEIGTKYDTYAAFTEDLSDWVAEQREARRDAKAAMERQQQTYRERAQTYSAKAADLRKQYADYDTAIASVEHILHPPVFQDAILSSERSAELTYWLATHPDVYQQLAQDALAVNHPSAVNLVRSVLESKLPPVASLQRSTGRDAAAFTGSAPTSHPVVTAPRPPNPVRTGPQKISDDAPEDDDGLEAHESFFHRRQAR